MSTPPPRRPALVVVWGGRRPDLARLRGAVGPHDQLVALDVPPGSSVRDTAVWPQLPEGFGALVHVPVDVVVGPRWLDRLMAALEPDGVGVAVPRSNGAPWPVCGPDVPDRDARGAEVSAHARHLAALGGEPEPCAPVGPCVAVRADALAAVRRAGLDGLAATPWASVLVPTAYVHVRAGVPEISACLIVKDEEADLGACLASLVGFVDEVVIHDTGSTDASVALARAAGATVIEGTWDDDFSVAREVARRAARGRWVLSIDADEVLEATPAEKAGWRAALKPGGRFELATLPLVNLHGSVHVHERAEHAIPLSRVFRRTTCHWAGALHEQPVTARGAVPPLVSFDAPRLVHHGYLAEHVAAKAKGERNQRIASGAVAEADDQAQALFELGRSYLLSRQWAQAMPPLEQALWASGEDVYRRAAAEFGAQVALRLGDVDRAGELADVLEGLGGLPDLVALVRAQVALERGDAVEALDALAGLGPSSAINDVFSTNDPSEITILRVGALVALGRVGEAEMALLSLVRNRSADGRVWLLVARVGDVLGTVPTGLVDRLDPAQVEAVCRLAAALAPEHAELVLDALLRHFGDNAHIYAYALPLLGAIDVEAAARWSSRLTRIGLAERCPLWQILRAGDRPASDRILAAAAVADQPQGATAIEELAVLVEDAAEVLELPALAPLLVELLDRGSPLAGHVVIGSATTTERCLELVGPLAATGHHDEALTVVLHGTTLAGEGAAEEFLRQAATRLGGTQVDAVRQLAQAAGVGELVAGLAA